MFNKSFVTLIAIFSLLGCGGGSSGANGSDPFDAGTEPVSTLSLVLLDGECNTPDSASFPTSSDICVQATLKTDGSLDSGEVVSFSLSNGVGTLSASTALTDSNGVAQITISNSTEQTGADTVTATFGSASASASYEYLPVLEVTPAITVRILQDGAETIRFRAGDTVSIEAQLTSELIAIEDTIVSFSVSGTGVSTEPEQSLTDADGIATSVMSADDSGVGAHVLTASAEVDGVTYSATQNFEVQPAQDVSNETRMSVSVLDAACNSVPLPSFTTNEQICIQTLLTVNDAPLAQEIINFSLNSALGVLSASSALTNSNGVAQVLISNPDADVGASAITAVYGTLSESSNYEYLALPPEVSDVPELAISMLQNGNQVSRFRSDEQVQLQALLLDADNQPLQDEIVNFSIQGTGPSLTPTTALTNAAGIAQVTLSADANSLGAFVAQASATLNSFTFSDSLNFEIQASGTVIDESETRFGHIDDEGNFIEGLIGSSAEENGEVVISAGATVGFNVALVDEDDERILTPTPVTFSSTCVTNGQATIDQSVTTINGIASATFEDINCAGSNGNSDQIIASVVINNNTLVITRDLTILPEDIGSLSFVSAQPDEIVLEGTGGQNSASVSTLTFQVNGELGNPLAQQEVAFSLNTSIGGLSISPQSGLTNSAGQVSTRVTAGSVPTAVRVTASATANDGSTIKTQSDLLSVNTGLPDQNSFSMSSSLLNPEAESIDGISATITVRLADSFNNPVPNGTTVNFTSEGGQIESTCSTGEDSNGVIDPEAANNGTCSVTWTSANPRPDDHRITILATAIGHETLFDANGNNAFDDADGGAIYDDADAGFEVSQYGQTGFVDMSEAWRDDNENGQRDSAEPIFDYNNDGSFSAADGLFNGPQCTSETLCGENNGATIHVRKALVMVMSGSDALWRVYSGDIDDADYYNDANIAFSNDDNVTTSNSLTIQDGETKKLTLVYYDSAEQVLPFGTEVGLIDADGDIASQVDTVNNTNRAEITAVPGNIVVLATLSNNTGASSSTQNFSYVIDTPAGTRTNVDFSVTLE